MKYEVTILFDVPDEDHEASAERIVEDILDIAGESAAATYSVVE